MNPRHRPLVLRLNCRSLPVSDEERAILAGIDSRVVEMEGVSDAEIAAAAAEADAVMVVAAYLRTATIRRMKRCRIISRLGTGVDKIDVEQATRQGIVVTNIPDFCTEEVADHTLALLLAAARRVREHDQLMRAGRRPFEARGMHRLAAQTAGLIGFGRIGRAVARRCGGFGLRLLVHDPAVPEADIEAAGATAAPLPAVLAESDYVCLLCPLLPSTRGMIGARELALMKRDAALINTGRGELVVEADLVEALRERRIRCAALDVFTGINVFAADGFAVDHPLFALDNVLLTPHVAAMSEESLADSQRRGAQAVVDVLTGKRPRYPVNPAALIAATQS